MGRAKTIPLGFNRRPAWADKQPLSKRAVEEALTEPLLWCCTQTLRRRGSGGTQTEACTQPLAAASSNVVKMPADSRTLSEPAGQPGEETGPCSRTCEDKRGKELDGIRLAAAG